jgi:multiple sugar transport system substrate-binding protein
MGLNPRPRATWRRPAAGLAVGMLCASAALTGCSTKSASGGSDQVPESKNAHATGALKVWVRGAGDSPKAYQKIFDAFTAKTGIAIEPFLTLTDFETKLTAAAAQHTLPDVVIDDAAQLGNFETQGIIRPVDRSQLAGADQIAQQAWTSATDLKGTVYAVPFSAQANVLLVRKDWLDKLGLQPPKTWDDLVNVAKAFTTQDPDGNGKNDTYGLALPASTARGYAAWEYSSFLWEAGGDFVKPGGSGKFTAALDTPEALQAAALLKDQVCTNKDVQPSAVNDDTTAANKAFQTGVTGLYLTGPYAYATMDATGVKGKYIAVAPPTGPSGKPATLAEGTDIFTMADAKTDEVKKLEEFMITPESQKLGMTSVPTATIVRLPVNTIVDAATEHGGDPRWQLAQQVYQTAGHYEPDNLPDWTALRQAASDGLNGMLATCSDPRAALGTINDKLNALLKSQGVG